MTLLNRLPPCGIGLLLAVLGSSSLLAQGTTTSTIRGHVTDSASSRPLQGVTVTAGSHSAVSRADGQYSITNVVPGDGILQARSIGFAPLSRPYSAVAGEVVEIDLVMVAQAVNLSEMVVVGYGEQRAADITGAVSNVTAEEFNTGRIVTPTELIQNKVAGVQVVESNEPGGGTSIRIRGPSSTSASSDPLYVVDGVPLGSAGTGMSGGRDALNFLNSNDIESITVLRDASAAAIYGTNAANGVVLITTKRGKAGQAPRFEYSGSFSASKVTRLPDMLSTSQFRAAVTEFAPANVSQLGTANTNWFDEIDRTGYGQEQNFAMSGAGTSSDYRLSASYLDQNGVIDATQTKRVTLGVNYNQKLANDRLNLKFSARGSRASDNFTPGGVLSNAAQMGPTSPIFDTLNPTGYFENTGGIQSPDNPVAILNLVKDNSITYRSIGNVQAGYDLRWIPGLTANLNLGYDVTKADRQQFLPSALHRETLDRKGFIQRDNNTQLNVVADGFLSYAAPKPVGPGILDLTGGYSYSTSNADFNQFQAKGLSTDVLGTGGIPSSRESFFTRDIQDSKLISFFGRVNYNINDRYLAALSVRHDGSSRFGPDNQWGTFPSVSAAWRLSEERFLKDRFSLSDLKLRASWAKTGNQSFGNYLYVSTYQNGDVASQYGFGDTLFSTIRPSAVDPNIKWEATRSVDLGIDFGFSNNRFTGAIDWYDKKTDDLIFRVPGAAGTNVGGNFLTTNIGSMRNRGLEFSLSARILQGGASNSGLKWTTDFTASHNTNELLSINPDAAEAQIILTGGIAGGVGSTIQVLTPGQPVFSFYVQTSRRNANGKPIYEDRDANGTINDDDLYVDVTGDGHVTSADLRPFHDPAPKWIMGHSSYFTYGKWDAGFTLRAYFGGYVYNNVASNLGTYSELTRGSPFNLHASVLETGFLTPQYLSDYYVENADFLRMDNLSLGYTFDLGGQQARVFGNVQNVFTISDYSGVDPTAGINGIDNNIYPRSRTFTGGLSLRF